MGTAGTAARSAIMYRDRRAFWFGTGAIIAGVVLHLPMFLGARDMEYQLVGMPLNAEMVAGMGLIVGGMALCAYALVPVRAARRPDDRAGKLRVQTLDEAPLRRAHVLLLLVMAAAVTIDVMKPTTLAFVVPGVAEEYGLKSPLHPDGDMPVAVFPLCALVGMVVGSFVWGWLGDRIGRRASILLAALMFIATAICGSMPMFELNIVMCFLMGMAVGGLLPIAFALLADTIPARQRSSGRYRSRSPPWRSGASGSRRAAAGSRGSLPWNCNRPWRRE